MPQPGICTRVAGFDLCWDFPSGWRERQYATPHLGVLGFHLQLLPGMV